MKSDLKEALAALSLAEDMANGNPPETALRAAALAAQIAAAAGLAQNEADDAFLTALLRFLGCTAFAPEEARLFAGDDIGFKRLFAGVDAAKRRAVIGRMLQLGGDSGPGRYRARLRALTRGSQIFKELIAAQCEMAILLARGLGINAGVQRAIVENFERFDGRGQPAGLSGAAISRAARIGGLAYAFEILRQRFGADLALAEVLRRSGGQFDPEFCTALAALPLELLDGGRASIWDRALELMPSVPGLDLRSIAHALADFADLKSRYSAGHSRRTATLARNAASIAGLDNAARDQIEIAALIMNIGMVGAPSGILEKPGPLSRTERETIEMHTIYSERILSSAEIFSDCLELACSHHERADRSGYHRRRGDLSLLESILAAADVYVALTSARAWRPALDEKAAARELEALRERGALHGRAVSVTLQAAGLRERRDYAERDALGLTAREQDVLRLVARGLTNKKIAAELGLSARTVQHHTIRIYEKLGVNSRAGATLQATLRGLSSG